MGTGQRLSTWTRDELLARASLRRRLRDMVFWQDRLAREYRTMGDNLMADFAQSEKERLERILVAQGTDRDA